MKCKSRIKVKHIFSTCMYKLGLYILKYLSNDFFLEIFVTSNVTQKYPLCLKKISGTWLLLSKTLWLMEFKTLQKLV